MDRSAFLLLAYRLKLSFLGQPKISPTRLHDMIMIMSDSRGTTEAEKAYQDTIEDVDLESFMGIWQWITGYGIISGGTITKFR
jgi:hypothetical protein